MTAAHLLTKRTKHNPTARKEGKLTLVRLLYKNRWKKEKIIDFFAILDWLIQLPPAEALEFNQQLAQLEEEQKMQYITSIERIGIQKGLQQGLEQGLERGLVQGLERGVEATLRQNIISLRDKLNFSAEKIANVLDVPLDKVKQIFQQTSH